MGRAAMKSVIAVALAAFGCAHRAPSPGPTEVALPGNWDDRYLDVAADGSSPRPALAVVPFKASPRVQADADLSVGPMLMTVLLKTGRFDLVEADKVEQLLEQQEFQQAAYFDPETKAKLGRMVGAAAVLFGEVTSATQQKVDKFAYDLIDTRVRIDVRAVDTATSRIIFAESAEGRSQARVITDARGTVISGAADTRAEFARAAAQATDVLGHKLSGQFPVTGVIVACTGSRFVTDLGSAKELNRGDELVVIRPLERLLHPLTKQPVGWRKAILGLARVEAVELGTSTANLVRPGETAQPLRAGDRVVLRRRTN